MQLLSEYTSKPLSLLSIHCSICIYGNFPLNTVPCPPESCKFAENAAEQAAAEHSAIASSHC